MFRIIALTMAVLTATACAHTAVAQSLCPTGTQAVRIVTKDTMNDFAPLDVMPSTGSDYDEGNPVMTWDISGATTTQFVALCFPNEEGAEGQTTARIPLGAQGCTLVKATGKFTCQ